MAYEDIFFERNASSVSSEIFVGRIIHKIFLIVWSPQGETNFLDIDCSLGISFKGDECNFVVVKASRIHHESFISLVTKVESVHSAEDFDTRLKAWMLCELDDVLSYEVFDMSHHNSFKNFIGGRILEIQRLSIRENWEELGYRIVVGNDFIEIVLNGDGSAVSNTSFNANASSNYQTFGVIEIRAC